MLTKSILRVNIIILVLTLAVNGCQNLLLLCGYLYSLVNTTIVLTFADTVALYVQVYLYLLRLYLSAADKQPVLSFAEENDHKSASETNLEAAFRLLGEQANRIDTVQVYKLSDDSLPLVLTSVL